MPSYAEKLATQREAVLDALIAHDAAKPSYSEQGRSVQWDQHRAQLMSELETLTGLIQAADPYVVVTRLYP